MFLYSDQGLFYRAYYIIPDSEGVEIQHQYGCVGCQQFTIKGRVEKVPAALAKKLDTLLSHNHSGSYCTSCTPEVISLETGLEVIDVLGEGLAKLADGRYIATENCD